MTDRKSRNSLLILQGPLGPFFGTLADEMRTRGWITHKINFNRGDRYYGRADLCTDYHGTADDWAAFLYAYMEEHQITAVIVYGDCRHYHSVAKQVCKKQGVRFFACEEGYVRPGFVTCEQGGNNAGSSFPEDFRQGTYDAVRPVRPHIERNIFFHQIWFTGMYYAASQWHASDDFNQYYHHRPGTWWTESCSWLLAAWRKTGHRLQAGGITRHLMKRYAGRMIIVPLQVAVDTQMIHHSPYDSVQDFIHEILTSFAAHASPDQHLVIKHHPMDRGFHHYGAFIDDLAGTHGVKGRVTYCFDVDLDALIKASAGVITVNSTVGITSLFAGRPTLFTGTAMAHTAGLSADCTLDAFWHQLPAPDMKKVLAYKKALIPATQVPGNFYKNRFVAACHIADKIIRSFTV